MFQRDVTSYDGLMDEMFLAIRQSSKGSAMVLIRMIDIYIKVGQCEDDAMRCAALWGHGELAWAEGQRAIADPSDRAVLGRRFDVLNALLPSA